MKSVLFVCLGNICRSPTAEGVFRHQCEQLGLADQIRIDSAGTAGWHVGKPPDARGVAAAANRGIDSSGLRGRQVTPADFYDFDLILAMDSANLNDLEILKPADSEAEIHRFLHFTQPDMPVDVPDPYYGRDDGFDYVLDLVEHASRGLIEDLRSRGWVF